MSNVEYNGQVAREVIKSKCFSGKIPVSVNIDGVEILVRSQLNPMAIFAIEHMKQEIL